MLLLQKYRREIEQLCMMHKVKHLYAFGSVLTKNITDANDIDLLVQFEPIDLKEYADNYYDLKFSLQAVLHKPIDLLEEQAITNPYFLANIHQQRQLLYEH